MQKTLTIILLVSAALWGLASCEGSYIDPGAMGMMGGGFVGGWFDDGDEGGSGGKGSSGGGGGSGGSGELWAKLTAGSGTWSRDNDSFTMKFTKTAEFSSDGYCELLITIPKAKPDDHDEYDFLEGKVYVKLNGATGNYWCGDLPASKNISFGGGSSDVGIVTFLSDTQMTISGTLSGWAKYYDGSYTRK